MQALADPTRRAILERLQRSDAGVVELAEPFEISLNSVSKHIKLLERARLVQRVRVGRGYRLSFNPDPFNEAVKWMNERQEFWAERLAQLADVLDSTQDGPDTDKNHYCNDGAGYEH